MAIDTHKAQGPREDSAVTITESIPVEVVARPEEDHWSAVILDFSIAGRGDSPRAAIENAVTLLGDYLTVSLRDGLTVQEARRPAPRGYRTKVRAAILLARLRHRATVEWRQILPAAPEDRPGDHHAAAHC